jgi:hypothetical protein
VDALENALAERRGRCRALGHVGESGRGVTEACELPPAPLAARQVLFELAALGFVESVQGVRRYEFMDEFLLHVT